MDTLIEAVTARVLQNVQTIFFFFFNDNKCGNPDQGTQGGRTTQTGTKDWNDDPGANAKEKKEEEEKKQSEGTSKLCVKCDMYKLLTCKYKFVIFFCLFNHTQKQGST